MKPSEVLDLIGRQHVQLRILFTEVEEGCRAALAGDKVALRPLLLCLVRAVFDHVAFEDRLLLPTLRQIDGWGSVRADRVAAEHALQRAELTALRHAAHRGDARDAAAAALGLIDELRADMDAEEHDLLSPELLRDDLVVIGQSGG